MAQAREGKGVAVRVVRADDGLAWKDERRKRRGGVRPVGRRRIKEE